MSADRTAVITVSYRSEHVLPEFLASLPQSSVNNPVVVVADNLPDDASSIKCTTERAGYRYLALDSNRGYGGGMNAAVKTLQPDIRWILISNPDVVLGEGVVDGLVRVGESDASIGAVGPQVLESDGSVYPSARAIPSLRNGIGHALFANLWGANPWTRSYRSDKPEALIRRDAGWLSGSCVLVRRDLFDRLGGFDEGYFMYFEDVDLGYRIGKAGYRNVYAPEVSVTHVGAHSTQGEPAAMIEAHHASARRFLSMKYRSAWLWPLRVVLDVGLTVRSRALRVRGHS